MTAPGVLSTGQVARACGMSQGTVQSWLNAGRLKFYRLPASRHRRVLLRDLLAFCEQYGMPCDLARQLNR